MVKGQPLIELESERLQSQLKLAIAQLDEAEAMERRAVSRSPAEAQIAAEFVSTMREQYRMLEDRASRLIVKSPQDGIVVGDDPRNLVGTLAQEGQPAVEVLDPDQLRVTATLGQTEGLWLYELPAEQYEVEVRPVSNVSHVINAKMDRVFAAGARELPHAALGYSGGGTIQTDPQDQGGKATKQPVFEAWLTPELDASHVGRPGERVTIRFTLPSKPLAAQWVDRLRKLIQGRVQI